MSVILESSDNAAAEVILTDKDGNPTIEAQIIEGFLAQVNFNDLFESPELAKSITLAKSHVLEDEDGLELVEADVEGAVEAEIETLPGELVAEAVDADDLYETFVYYANHCLPSGTLEEKTRLAVALALLPESDVLDEWKKGSFKKLVAGGKGGRHQVLRMIGAMLQHGAIVRTKGGHYSKGANYRHASASKMRKVAAFKKSHKGQIAKSLKKDIGARKLRGGGRVTAGDIKRKVSMLAHAKKGKKESDETQPAAKPVTESRKALHEDRGPALTAGILESMGKAKKAQK